MSGIDYGWFLITSGPPKDGTLIDLFLSPADIAGSESSYRICNAWWKVYSESEKANDPSLKDGWVTFGCDKFEFSINDQFITHWRPRPYTPNGYYLSDEQIWIPI